MTENDAEEKFYTVDSSIRSVMNIAVSVPNSPSLDVVHNFVYRKPSSSLDKSNVFIVTSKGHLRLPWHAPTPRGHVAFTVNFNYFLRVSPRFKGPKP